MGVARFARLSWAGCVLYRIDCVQPTTTAGWHLSVEDLDDVSVDDISVDDIYVDNLSVHDVYICR